MFSNLNEESALSPYPFYGHDIGDLVLTEIEYNPKTKLWQLSVES